MKSAMLTVALLMIVSGYALAEKPKLIKANVETYNKFCDGRDKTTSPWRTTYCKTHTPDKSVKSGRVVSLDTADDSARESRLNISQGGTTAAHRRYAHTVLLFCKRNAVPNQIVKHASHFKTRNDLVQLHNAFVDLGHIHDTVSLASSYLDKALPAVMYSMYSKLSFDKYDPKAENMGVTLWLHNKSVNVGCMEVFRR